MAQDVSIRGLEQLAAHLKHASAAIGDWPVYARLRHSAWDGWRAWFEKPDPIVEATIDSEAEKVQVYLGGAASPPLAGKEPLTDAAFVDALERAAAAAPGLPLMVAMRVDLQADDGEEYQYVLNLPIKSLSLKPDASRRRAVFVIYCERMRVG